jgi:UDP-3-O-[3-hydroxymyristoyl] glucosamine N-acyltransferase
MELTVKQLAERLCAELVGAGDEIESRISAVAAVEAAGESEVTFVTSDKHIAAAGKSRAAAVIVARRIDGLSKPQLVVKNVDVALIEVLKFFAPVLKPAAEGIDPSANLGRDVKIAKKVSIGPNVVVSDRVEIGENSVIGSGCKIGENSKVGKNCRLDSNVVVYHNCCLGDSVIVQANSTIGSTGFGYSFIEGSPKLIPHNGGVVIEDFVEIGANCCIDRAKFGNTRIGAGTKIDNLVQIAHNVIIGKCCLIVGQAGIAGSCKLGDGVVLGGQVGLADNIEIGDGAMVSGQAGVVNDIKAGQQVAWTPAVDRRKAFRIISLMMRLPKMAEQLEQLERKLEKLVKKED